MATFTRYLSLLIRARSAAQADGIAQGACDHLRDTFNDDESIRGAAALTLDGIEAPGAVLRIDGNAYALRDGVLWGAPVHADGRVSDFDPAGEWYEIDPAELDAGSAKQAGRALLALRTIAS